MAQTASHFAPLTIISTSSAAVDALTTSLQKLEESGYIGRADKDLIRAAAATLRERGAVTRFRITTNEEGSREALGLALVGATDPDIAHMAPLVPAKFNLEGAQLSTLSQAYAYAGIHKSNPPPQRTKTDIRLDMTRHAVRDACGIFPTDETIWAPLCHPDIARNIRNFLWKTAHQLQKVGEYWSNIPKLEA